MEIQHNVPFSELKPGSRVIYQTRRLPAPEQSTVLTVAQLHAELADGHCIGPNDWFRLLRKVDPRKTKYPRFYQTLLDTLKEHPPETWESAKYLYHHIKAAIAPDPAPPSERCIYAWAKKHSVRLPKGNPVAAMHRARRATTSSVRKPDPEHPDPGPPRPPSPALPDPIITQAENAAHQFLEALQAVKKQTQTQGPNQ